MLGVDATARAPSDTASVLVGVATASRVTVRSIDVGAFDRSSRTWATLTVGAGALGRVTAMVPRS